VSNGTNDTYQWYYESIANPGSPYQIDGNDTEINYDTDTMTIQDVVTGQYDGYFVFCEVTNSLGCVAKSTNDSIWVHDLPTVSAIASDTTICANSLLTLTGSGAETYNWNNGVTDNTAFTINASNTYTVIGIDTNNCQDTATIEITVNEIPSIDLTSQNVSCNGNNDGSATANVSGGTPNYSYSWAPSGGTNSIASGLVAGIYSLTITDANNCAVNQTVTITEPAAIDNTTSITNLTITTNATGVTYQWIDCNNGNTAIAGETNQSFTATANGNYAVIVTQNGCSDTSACVAINNVGITENNFGEDLLIYPNPTNGELTIDLGANYHDVNLIVRNTLGQVIFRKSFNATKLLSFNLIGDPGVYLIEVGVADKQAIMRVIKK
jgi:uncharacterized protein (DUF2141 family)